MKQPLSNALLMASAIFFSSWCHSEPIGGVALSVRSDNTNAMVSWPYPSTGFGLEFSTKLGTTGWQPAAGTALSNNGRWEVTAPPTCRAASFRLKNHVQHFGFWAGSLAPQGSIVEQRGSVNFTYLQAGLVGFIRPSRGLGNEIGWSLLLTLVIPTQSTR